ncbi:MAG: DUF3576 domain-containing protein [Alphaproteobacteria bacterium]|nr:DUF3576 domain-containing protein [Alphaproteobacteria bacterium]
MKNTRLPLQKSPLKALGIVLPLAALAFTGGCNSTNTEAKYPTGYDRETTGGDIYGERESIFGADGLNILGRKKDDDSGNTGIGVNSFLWRASLDTVSFMPLASADPFGGTILTDWYTPEGTEKERFKLNVFILDRQLRSDGVQVRVFRQILKGGAWKTRFLPVRASFA